MKTLKREVERAFERWLGWRPTDEDYRYKMRLLYEYIEELEEALRFYADPANYKLVPDDRHPDWYSSSKIDIDAGYRARAALSDAKEGKVDENTEA